MCGIAGIVSLRSRQECGPVDVGRLTSMRDSIVHRGPDGAGVWTAPGVGLAHRRLAIVDVAGGHQPMCNEDETVWIVFNGEIYNHAEWRPRLERNGHRYRTRSDTETILHLYEEVGDAVVDGLRGMFAFAIWDVRRQRLLLARDRLGIKPLYYAEHRGELLFGSEIKALVAGGVRPEVNQSAVPELLATRFVSGDRTLLSGVRRLEPGNILTWSASEGLHIRSYWQPGMGPERVETRAHEVDGLKRRLDVAVERHLMSDVPLGVFLSGGIDSTALAALTTRISGAPIDTFAVGCGDAGSDDLPFARLAAKAIGSRHHERLVTPQEFFGALPRLIWHEDEPIAFTSSVPLYFVSALAAERVKVVLTGEGADELFLGYNRYRVTLWNSRLGRPYWALMPNAGQRAIRHIIRGLPRSARRYVDRSFLALKPGVRNFYLENFAVFPGAMRAALLGTRSLVHEADPYRTTTQAFDVGGGDLRARMSRADMATYLHELLMKQDQMSMAASIESRVPFLDDDLVSYVSRLPSRFKLRAWQTKSILREAVRDVVPRAVLERRKMGFPVPMASWLRRPEWAGAVDDLLLGSRTTARGWFDPQEVRRLLGEHCAGRANHSERLWLLINFELWQRVVCEGQAWAEAWPTRGKAKAAHADSLDQDGRALAAEHGRPATQLSYRPRTGSAA
jgi:asparagine synthase (glutamine-hydrolysing)